MDTLRGFFTINSKTTFHVYHITDSFAKKKSFFLDTRAQFFYKPSPK